MKRVLPILLLLWALRGWAGESVTLAWDASPSTGITAYRVYYGPASRTYTNFVSVPGTQLTAVVSNLVQGATYYFAATALAGELESDFSNEVSYTVPRPRIRGPGATRAHDFREPEKRGP